MAREFSRVGVVGLGVMGAGIAEVLARTGMTVIGVEVDDAGVERAKAHMEASTGRAVEHGKLTASERDELLGRIRLTTDLSELADVQLVMEAAPERLDVKKQLLVELDRICAPETVLATGTSTLSVTELAVETKRPSKVLGLHWFNPAPVMSLVEIVRTVITEPDVIADAEALVDRCGKNRITLGDKAGFIANALLLGYLNQAVGMYEARYAIREDIDAAMRLGCGLPMGPLELQDLFGLDCAYDVLDTMFSQSGDMRLAPAPILKQLVTAGYLGRKSGRGFYSYESQYSPSITDIGEHSGPSLELARSVQRVGVVGTGTMASGIVEVCARAGYDVVFRARGDDKVAATLAKVDKSLSKMVQRGRLAEPARQKTLDRITGTSDLDGLTDCDLVIEAVVEDLPVKRELFRSLDEVVKPGAVLATTTSSLAVIDCAMATGRPEDVVGMHWFNPATVMKLVEIVPTVRTADDVTATISAVCRHLGKHPVNCADRAGFIVNALLFPYLNDAVKMVEAHYATVDEVDIAMRQGCGMPMGPFELLDVVGLDVSLAIQQTLYQEFREPGFAPAPLLEHLVTAGYLGRKSGRGFRTY